jgi:hypothetical protein
MNDMNLESPLSTCACVVSATQPMRAVVHVWVYRERVTAEKDTASLGTTLSCMFGTRWASFHIHPTET